MLEKEEGVLAQVAEQSEKGYITNKGMPSFVGDVEIKRLRKIIDEKNTVIESFKKYDEVRKEYYAGMMEDFKEMKSSFDQFNEELLKVVDDGDMTKSDYKRFMKLYANWLAYKNEVILYKNTMSSVRQNLKSLVVDLKKLECMTKDIADMSLLETVTERIYVMRQHLEVARSHLIMEV